MGRREKSKRIVNSPIDDDFRRGKNIYGKDAETLYFEG
jgi:hypothetical protein